MIEYPKIDTLWGRDKESFTVIPGAWRNPAFADVSRWLVTEKIDGTNIRVLWDGERVLYGGRTDRANIPAHLLTHLMETFTVDNMAACFSGPVCLYGEGYGPKIQKGGGKYRDTPSFRLFDVRVGEIWLEWHNVEDIAEKLGIVTAPVLERAADFIPYMESELRSLVPYSFVAQEESHGDWPAEGVVARSPAGLLDRRGHRVMWKLKFSDFRAGKR